MKNLKQQLINESNEYKAMALNNINSLLHMERYATDIRRKQYANYEITEEQYKRYTTNRLEKQYQKALNSKLEQLEFVTETGNIFKDATITVEWTKSRMWGNNPKAHIEYHYIDEDKNNRYSIVGSESIGGCGYDKESTAIAQALNKINSLMTKMYQAKNDSNSNSSHEVLGYGAGYGVLPYFEGGVGVSAFYKIFNNLGLEFKSVAHGKTFDVYTVK